MSRIGLLHPGAMGASIGAQLTSKTHTVLWWPEGRSERSAKRAEQAGLTPPRRSMTGSRRTTSLAFVLLPANRLPIRDRLGLPRDAY